MNTLFKIIKKKIEENSGFISFEEYMNLCLYHPYLGYYERNSTVSGKKGDYYTNVSVGSLFGYLLAFKFSEFLDNFKQQKNIYLVESGAHDGQLACDILDWLSKYSPELFDKIRYLIIEPSLKRREWQQNKLSIYKPKIIWCSSFLEAANYLHKNESKCGVVDGIIFSNELLDAFPIHRLFWDKKEQLWYETGVTCKNNELEFIKIDLSESCNEFLKKIDSRVMEIIPDGFVFELSTMAIKWWKEAANILRYGKLIAFDYGFESPGFLNPLFPSGTLRAYQKHHSTNNVLISPGEQDLTADVNFSMIIKAGEDCDLTTEYFGSQELFFSRIVEKLSENEFPEWFTNNFSQFKTLTHPEHLGRQIKVLVQSKK